MKHFLLFPALSFVALSLFAIPPADNHRTEHLLNLLHESEAYILSTFADVEASHWSHKSDDNRWSIAECAEHILTAEKAILSSIQELLETSEPTQKAEPNSDEDVLNILYDRVNKKVKTLEPFEPKGYWSTKSEFISAFKTSRKALYDFLDQNDVNLHQYFTMSPAGEVSLHQMLLVLSGHTARHTHQVEEIKHELGLSTATIAFGGNVKVNVHTSQREAIRSLFGDILLLDIDQKSNYDRVLFDQGGFVAFVYHDDKSQLLPKEAFANSMQAGLKTTPAFFESLKRRIIASGAEVYSPPYEVNPTKDFYFHAPGGQVFRLVKES